MSPSRPTLTGRRVLLRPLSVGDAAALHAMTLDPEGRRLTGTHARFTPEEIRAWCEGVAAREDRVDLAILERESGEFLGEVVLNEIDEHNRSCLFRISLSAPRHRGRGYGGEAAALALEHAFRALALHRVELEVFDFNERALRLYERLGFRREGVRREALLWEGRRHDAIVMGLLAHEHDAARQSV